MGFNATAMYETDSKWLKAADLAKQEHTVTIDAVTMAELDNNGRKEQKLEVRFAGREKTLLLNKTNCDAIVYAYGADTDGWLGKQIVLYPTMVDYQGRPVEAIRVRAVLPQAAPVQAAQPGQVPADASLDDVPF